MDIQTQIKALSPWYHTIELPDGLLLQESQMFSPNLKSWNLILKVV